MILHLRAGAIRPNNFAYELSNFSGWIVGITTGLGGNFFLILLVDSCVLVLFADISRIYLSMIVCFTGGTLVESGC